MQVISQLDWPGINVTKRIKFLRIFFIQELYEKSLETAYKPTVGIRPFDYGIKFCKMHLEII
jgi:hypothetical protein